MSTCMERWTCESVFTEMGHTRLLGKVNLLICVWGHGTRLHFGKENFPICWIENGHVRSPDNVDVRDTFGRKRIVSACQKRWISKSVGVGSGHVQNSQKANFRNWDGEIRRVGISNKLNFYVCRGGNWPRLQFGKSKIPNLLWRKWDMPGSIKSEMPFVVCVCVARTKWQRFTNPGPSRGVLSLTVLDEGT